MKPVSEGGYGKTEDDLWTRYHVKIGADRQRVVAGGGEQRSETVPAVAGNHQTEANTSVWTETEMVNNRPTPDIVAEIPEDEFPDRRRAGGPWRRSDRRDHVVHKHVESERDACGGTAREESCRTGLSVSPKVKNSLAPGSRVVTDYLERTGLQPYLNELGFNLVGYGCTTCIGNSGPLDPAIEQIVNERDVIGASVLSGNRNFEARVHQSIKANFLMSPPLVVAFALAGRVDIDLSSDPIGTGKDGEEVYLRDIWPTMDEINDVMRAAFDPETYQRLYSNFAEQNPLWNEIPTHAPATFTSGNRSRLTFASLLTSKTFTARSARCLTSKARGRSRSLVIQSRRTTSVPRARSSLRRRPGLYLQDRGVDIKDFNSYGARRGNHEVMVRGTFANVRIKNLMVPGVEGGVTIYQPDGERMSIYDAAMRYQSEGVPLVIIAGQEYGTGSSRDWAAKGTRLLGVRAVIAQSFERIHRSNLVGMGVLPCQFKDDMSAASLRLDGSETFDLLGIETASSRGRK